MHWAYNDLHSPSSLLGLPWPRNGSSFRCGTSRRPSDGWSAYTWPPLCHYWLLTPAAGERVWETLRWHEELGKVRPGGRNVTLTFSMVRLPPNRVMNSAGEATVKSLWRSIFRCSRPFFTRWRPDMLGLTRTQRSQTQQLLSALRIGSRVSYAKTHVWSQVHILLKNVTARQPRRTLVVLSRHRWQVAIRKRS